MRAKTILGVVALLGVLMTIPSASAVAVDEDVPVPAVPEPRLYCWMLSLVRLEVTPYGNDGDGWTWHPCGGYLYLEPW